MTNKTKGDIPDPGTEEAAKIGGPSPASDTEQFEDLVLEAALGGAMPGQVYRVDPSRLLEALKRATEP